MPGEPRNLVIKPHFTYTREGALRVRVLMMAAFKSVPMRASIIFDNLLFDADLLPQGTDFDGKLLQSAICSSDAESGAHWIRGLRAPCRSNRLRQRIPIVNRVRESPSVRNSMNGDNTNRK